MPVATGYHSRLAAGKETVYGAAVDCTDRIPFTAESLSEEWKLDQSEVLTGKSGWRSAERKGKSVGGSFDSYLCYDKKRGSRYVGTDLILTTALGAATWDAANSVNQITLTEELNRFTTIAILKYFDTSNPNNSIVWELISSHIKSLELGGTAGEPAKLGAEMIAYDLLRTNTTNTAAELLALPDDPPSRCHFGDLIVRIGSPTEPLGNSDRVQIKSFTLKLDNKLSDPLFATPSATGFPAGNLTAQPVRAGIRDVTLDLTFARYEDQYLFAHLGSLSALQADLRFSSGSHYVWILLPHLVVEEIEAPISGAELIEKKVKLRALRGADYPPSGNTLMRFSDGVTAISEEFGIETKDERTAAP